jgi:hypothetical protein
LISKLTNEIFPYQGFAHMSSQETIIFICCIIFSLLFQQGLKEF